MERKEISFEVDSETLIVIDDLCQQYVASRKTVCYQVFMHGLLTMFKDSSKDFILNLGK